jgi:hypothetical protein
MVYIPKRLKNKSIKIKIQCCIAYNINKWKHKDLRQLIKEHGTKNPWICSFSYKNQRSMVARTPWMKHVYAFKLSKLIHILFNLYHFEAN